MKRCIVCNKPIAKSTRTFEVKPTQEAKPEHVASPWTTIPAKEAKPEGHVDRGSWRTVCYTDQPPTTPEECGRFTNHQIVRFKRGAPGQGITEFATWDGESYRDPYFHSETCAAKQGRASAEDGHRWTWRRADDAD